MNTPEQLPEASSLKDAGRKIREIITYLRSLRLTAGQGIRLDHYAAGTTISLSHTPAPTGKSSANEYTGGFRLVDMSEATTEKDEDGNEVERVIPKLGVLGPHYSGSGDYYSTYNIVIYGDNPVYLKPLTIDLSKRNLDNSSLQNGISICLLLSPFYAERSGSYGNEDCIHIVRIGSEYNIKEPFLLLGNVYFSEDKQIESIQQRFFGGVAKFDLPPYCPAVIKENVQNGYYLANIYANGLENAPTQRDAYVFLPEVAYGSKIPRNTVVMVNFVYTEKYDVKAEKV